MCVCVCVCVCCKLCLCTKASLLHKDKNGNASVKGGGDQKQRETAWAATITHINAHAPVKSHVVRCAVACAHRNNTLTKRGCWPEKKSTRSCSNVATSVLQRFQLSSREESCSLGKSPTASAAKRVVVGPHARQLHRRLTLVSLLHHSLRQGALPPTPTLVWHGVCGYAVSAVLSRKFISSPMAPSARGNNPSATSSLSLARVLSRTSTSTSAPPQPASSPRVSIMPCTRRWFLAASLYKLKPQDLKSHSHERGPDGEFIQVVNGHFNSVACGSQVQCGPSSRQHARSSGFSSRAFASPSAC